MHIALSPQDNVAYPQLAQVLPGASVTRFSGLGHLQLCCDPKVVDWVLAKLFVAQTVPAAVEQLQAQAV